jgi:hypothetical protein
MLVSSSSMTALRGPWWLRPRLLATSKSCTRLSRATIHKRPARACAAPEVDRSQHASSIPPKAMASPVSELIHNTAVLAVPTTYPKLFAARCLFVTAPPDLVRLPTLLFYYNSLTSLARLGNNPCLISSIPPMQTCPLLPPYHLRLLFLLKWLLVVHNLRLEWHLGYQRQHRRICLRSLPSALPIARLS